MDRIENMRAVRGKNTKPEKTVGSMLHKRGYRFRLHRTDLPGKPDLVFPSLKKVIFVHGCFWHSHDCRKGQGAPVTNSGFWQRKRELTVQRDRKTITALADQGWGSYIVWECTLRNPESVATRLERFLSE
ncbi:MAG TPA: very short patch repair endonuclease [Bryobacteraceae bacterium]|nr:very short patch repair endonuclease [Bryobacteraceae bacterium]HTF69498.1 very short patch repair endonuclease [Edaphobacter sp.]